MRLDDVHKAAERITTPSRLAMELAPELIAEEYQVDPWLLDMERRVLEAWASPYKEGRVINVPSQCGKSSWSGFWFPMWLLGMRPTERGLYISFNETFSSDWTRKVRDGLRQFGEELFGVKINPDNNMAGDWRILGTQGGMKAVGILGGITGRPGDFVIIEDVIRNMEEAGSQVILDKHWREFTGMIIPRVQRGGLVLVIATRYAEGDLSGRLIEYIDNLEGEPDRSGIHWEHLNYQAIAEPPEGYDNRDDEWRDPVLGRKAGEELLTRHGPGHFHGMKQFLSEADPYAWAAIYQGDPLVPEGSSFPHEQWLWYDPDDEEFMAQVFGRIRVWDIAATERGGDFTCGELWGRFGNAKLVVLDVIRHRYGAANVRNLIRGVAEMDGRGVPIYLEREKAGAGKSVVDLYKEDMADFMVEGIEPDGNKASRINWYSNLQQRSMIMLPTHAHWLAAWLKEHRAVMPDGRMPRYDDQIDAGAYAALTLRSTGETAAFMPALRSGEQVGQALADRIGVPFGGSGGVLLR